MVTLPTTRPDSVKDEEEKGFLRVQLREADEATVQPGKLHSLRFFVRAVMHPPGLEVDADGDNETRGFCGPNLREKGHPPQRPLMQSERVGSLAYRLILPPELSRIHNVFHVSMLRKYIADHSHVLVEQPISLQNDLSYEEEPVQILDRKERVLRNKVIPLVKVLWRSHQVEEATWESEEQIRQQYPYLFD
ncbi:hypothetical protein ACLB2K_052684 [Fragaria x ananassa]